MRRALVVASAMVAVLGLVTAPAAGAAPRSGATSARALEAAATSTQGPPSPSFAAWAARGFLARYETPDGRVVRWDQGGDTVSEGQAYAMLLAVAVGDRGRFRAAWTWARTHLAQPTGLLAWHWADGRVLDRVPASDADLDAAWSLALAARRFHEPAYAVAAGKLGQAILSHETATVDGRPVLVAGPWAAASRTVEPGYFSPVAYQALARATGTPAWAELAQSSQQLASQLATARTLPADWVVLSSAGRAEPVGDPGRPGAAPQFGLDAARLEVNFAASCSGRARQIAASGWRLLGPWARRGRFALADSLSGRPLSRAVHPAMATAAAATAVASGRRRIGDRLLEEAARLDLRFPTYYGSAWVALGSVLLTTTWLGNCRAS